MSQEPIYKDFVTVQIERSLLKHLQQIARRESFTKNREVYIFDLIKECVLQIHPMQEGEGTQALTLNLADRIMQWVKRRKKQRFASRDCIADMRKYANGVAIHEALDLLIEAGSLKVKFEINPETNRTIRCYEVIQ